MKVHISVNDADTLDKLNGLSPEAYVEAWAEAILQLAKKNAREKLGGNFGAKTIAGSVEQQSSGLTAEVYTGGPSGYIGEAVHKGGMFRSRNGKMLALPLDPSVKKDGEYEGIFPRNIPFKMFALKSKKGNLLLFRRAEKGGKLGPPLFLLRKGFRHRPRPWWPTKSEVTTATTEFFEDNF